MIVRSGAGLRDEQGNCEQNINHNDMASDIETLFFFELIVDFGWDYLFRIVGLTVFVDREIQH